MIQNQNIGSEMPQKETLETQLEELQYNIANANNKVLNLHHSPLDRLSEEVKNTEKELESISQAVQSNLEEISNAPTDELYALKDESRSIADRLSQMIKQIEAIKEINSNLLELIEMKDANGGQQDQ